MAVKRRTSPSFNIARTVYRYILKHIFYSIVMPSPQSMFQTLPCHIMEQIMHFANGTADPLTRDTVIPDQNTSIALLATCHTWRSLLISQLCSELFILLDDANPPVATMLPRWPKKLGLPSFPTRSLVKKLKVQIVRWSSLMDGSALHRLQSSIYKDVTFPAAYTLVFSIVDVATNINTPIEEIESARKYSRELARCIRAMAPNTRESDISWPNVYHVALKQGLAALFKTEHFHLYSNVKRVSFTEYGGFDFPGNIPPSGNIQLTHLSFRCKSSYMTFIRLACNCAPTLQELIVHDFPKDGSCLITDTNGCPVIYPRLEKLYIAQSLGIQGLVLPKSHNLTYFPVLRSLDIRCQYPFGDDVLFRNNHKTLEHISLPFDIKFISMADEYQIFTPGKFKRLRSFNILNYYGAQGKLPRLIEMTTRCATNLSLSGTTDRMHVVKWSGISEESEMLVALVSIKTLANIQVLELPKCVFQFSEMVIALRALTHVKRLWFSLGKKPASVDDVRMPKLPDYITSNCYPVGKFLYSVTFDIESKASAKQMATAAMLFAVASPSLVRVEVPNAAEQEFASEIKTSVAKRPFVKYAERVKSLIKSI